MKFCLMLLFVCISSVQAFLPVAKVASFKGKPMLNKEKLVLGAEVSEGSLIALNRGDQVKVEFQNGHILEFGAGEYLVSVLNPKELLLEVVSGTVRVNVSKLSENENIALKSLMTTIQSSQGQWILSNNQKQQRITVKAGEIKIQRLKESMVLKSNEEAVIELKTKFDKKKISEKQVLMAMSSLK